MAVREARFYGDPADCVDELRKRGEREAEYEARKQMRLLQKKRQRIKSLVKLAKEGKLHGRG